MPTQIVARAAGCHRDDATECLIASFAEWADGSGLGPLFQIATSEPHDQDLKFGWDTYCITTGDQRGTCYGGLLQAHLVETELSLLFTPESASKLCLEAEVKVRLDVEERSLRAFKDALPEVVLVRWGRADQVPILRIIGGPGCLAMLCKMLPPGA